MFSSPEHRKVNYLINLLIVISLLLGSVTPGLAFNGEEQRERGKLARGDGTRNQTALTTTHEQASGQADDEPSPAWLRLTAVASPEAAAPGEVVMLAWQVENLGGQAQTGAVLAADMPAGVVVQPKQVEPPLAYDPAAKLVTWALAEVAAGESQVASLPMRVTGQRVGEVVEIVGELRAADGTMIDASTATVRATPPSPAATHIGPEGGVVSLEGGRVTLSFAPGAVAADVTVLARALGRPEKAPGNIERAYEFNVKGANDEDIHTFAQPVTLAVRHPEGQPEAGRLFVLEEATGEWQMLATRWDAEQGALVAEIPHLSTTAEGNNFVPEVMPSIRGVQSELFTGSASYAYPIETPPGAGGLTPQVGLQFSSRSRGEDLGHASVVGAGWKLTGDSFRYWTPWLTGSSAPTLRVEGAAFSEISNANGERTFKEAPQWRVVGDPTWQTTADVYAPNGARYHYEAAMHDWYCDGTTWQQRTDKWVLQYIVDRAGNRINYTYDTAAPVDPVNVNSNYPAYGDRVRTVRITSPCSNNGAGGNQDIHYLSQINLTRISYNSLNGVDQSVIDFSYAITRTDSALANANDITSWAHATTRLLTGVVVKQAGALVASYKLDYDFFDKPPGGGDNERLYALRSIRRCSDAGMTNCLPATTFLNTRTQMTQIDNGYGGLVGLGYGPDSSVTSQTLTDSVSNSVHAWTYTYANRGMGRQD